MIEQFAGRVYPILALRTTRPRECNTPTRMSLARSVQRIFLKRARIFFFQIFALRAKIWKNK
jgi:hypothetical protein